MNMKKDVNNTRILITGGSGYIASNLIQRLSSHHCDITIITRKDSLKEKTVGKATIHSLHMSVTDINNWKPVLSGIDVIYHLAAQTSIYQANQDPEQDLLINVLPLIRMLETCRACNFRPVIIFASTSTISGIPTTLPVDDSAPDDPMTIYDLHKKIAEDYLLFYIQQNVVTGSILRLTNVYGPGPKSSNADRGVINQMIKRALQSQDLTLYGSGNYIRDYVFIDDVVDAFIKAYEYSGNLDGGHYVIGSGKGRTIKEAFQIIQEITMKKTGKSAQITHVDPPENLHPIEKRNFVANSRRYHDLTGWTPGYLLEEGLNITTDFYLNNGR